MADTMVSVRSSELGSLGWEAVTKHQLFLQKVSSKLGPNHARRGTTTSSTSTTNNNNNNNRVEKGQSMVPPAAGSGSRLPGQGGPRQSQSESSTLRQDGGGSPTRTRPSQALCQGIPKPRITTDRALKLTSQGAATSTSKPAASLQPGLGTVGRAAASTESKLPVKGLSTSLSSSSLGSNDNNGSTSKVSPAPPAQQGCKPDRSAVASTSSPSDTNTAAPKLPALNRALSLQARTSATGLKAPAVTNHTIARTASANQTAVKMAPTANYLAKPTSQSPLQRSSSARFNRMNGSGNNTSHERAWR